MAQTADVIEFTKGDPSALLIRIRVLADREEGWINIGPGLTPEDFSMVPARSTLSRWLSGRGPAVPMATWTPASSTGRGRPAQLGLAHGTGPNAMPRLEGGGVTLPTGWRKKQDHAKNGIVIELPAAVAADAVVAWAMRAMVVLSPTIELGDEWIAEAYGPA